MRELPCFLQLTHASPQKYLCNLLGAQGFRIWNPFHSVWLAEACPERSGFQLRASLLCKQRQACENLGRLFPRYEAVGHPAPQGSWSCAALPTVRGWWTQASPFMETFVYSIAFWLRITNFETFAVPSSMSGKMEGTRCFSTACVWLEFCEN